MKYVGEIDATLGSITSEVYNLRRPPFAEHSFENIQKIGKYNIIIQQTVCLKFIKFIFSLLIKIEKRICNNAKE